MPLRTELEESGLPCQGSQCLEGGFGAPSNKGHPGAGVMGLRRLHQAAFAKGSDGCQLKATTSERIWGVSTLHLESYPGLGDRPEPHRPRGPAPKGWLTECRLCAPRQCCSGEQAETLKREAYGKVQSNEQLSIVGVGLDYRLGLRLGLVLGDRLTVWNRGRVSLGPVKPVVNN